jgi:4,5-dihydroxyphthalate decarboxylase
MTAGVAPAVTLYSLLGNHAGTEALKSGRVTSPLVAFEYADVKVVNTQFKAMMRDLKYDFGELAINTFLQGYEYQKPYVLLPVTTNGRNQHHTIFYNADRGPLTPHELSGKRVGVRAYTQTTGVWVRGFLAEDYGVDLTSVTWVTFEDAHLAEYRDPENVERAAAGKQLKQMLLDGEIDAAILGDVAEEGPLKHMIPNHAASGQRWARTHGGVVRNHVLERGRTAASRSTTWPSSASRSPNPGRTWSARCTACSRKVVPPPRCQPDRMTRCASALPRPAGRLNTW